MNETCDTFQQAYYEIVLQMTRIPSIPLHEEATPRPFTDALASSPHRILGKVQFATRGSLTNAAALQA